MDWRGCLPKFLRQSFECLPTRRHMAGSTCLWKRLMFYCESPLALNTQHTESPGGRLGAVPCLRTEMSPVFPLDQPYHTNLPWSDDSDQPVTRAVGNFPYGEIVIKVSLSLPRQEPILEHCIDGDYTYLSRVALQRVQWDNGHVLAS